MGSSDRTRAVLELVGARFADHFGDLEPFGCAVTPTHALQALDALIADCPPSVGPLTQSALAASSEVLMPIQCEYFAMEGLTQMIHAIRDVMQRPGSCLAFGGIVLTMYEPQLELTGEVEAEVRDPARFWASTSWGARKSRRPARASC